MRVLLVPPAADYSVADVAAGWLSGLRSIGVEVFPHPIGSAMSFYANARVAGQKGFTEEEAAILASEGVLAAAIRWKPHVALFVCGWEIHPDVFDILRARGVTVVLHHTESPYEDDRQASMAGLADLHLVNDIPGVDALTAAGARAFYAAHCYDPAIHHPGDGEKVHDFVFVGSGFRTRGAFLRATPWGDVRPLVVGAWPEDELTRREKRAQRRLVDRSWPQPLPRAVTADLYRAARTSANLYRVDNLDRPELVHGWSMGPRDVELAACGTWFARTPREEGDELLSMLPVVTTPGELGDAVAWALANPDKREAAAAAARAAVATRTFGWLAGALLHALDALPVAA